MGIKVSGTKVFEQKIKTLKQQTRKQVKEAGVSAGYATSYAVYVHEDTTANHPTGSAKFLESPSRSLKSRMGALIAQKVREGRSLQEAFFEAAELLMAVSREQVPVDTSAMKTSGSFIAATTEEDAAATQAFQRATAHRQRMLTARKVASKLNQ